ncbi:MAG TPA: LytTR family DNA-binding domain-containing protein [Allosphingosinicella sp.]|nr:LytTR family DNA-binding domain-containing protein [Allosphingosinicella sp.]
MNLRAMVEGNASHRRFGETAFWALAAGFFFLAYLAVLKLVAPGSWWDHGVASLINLLPVAILALPLRFAVVRGLSAWRPGLQLAGHLVLAPVFALGWYWLLMILIGFVAGASATRFEVRPFLADVAVAWQLLQGLAIYSLLAALFYLRARPPAPSFVVGEASAPEDRRATGLSRYFIRRGEDIHPIDVATIVSIAGADDYAEVATMSGRHLVRMTLGDFEKALAGGPFIRVHRSRIVNVERIVRAEPAGGGRMLLHMEDGELVQASRAGTRLLRDRVL